MSAPYPSCISSPSPIHTKKKLPSTSSKSLKSTKLKTLSLWTRMCSWTTKMMETNSSGEDLVIKGLDFIWLKEVMYSISKIMRRSRRFNLAPSSFGAVTKLEISIGDKESAFKSSGLIFSSESQSLIRRYSSRDVISRFIGINKLSSVADAMDKGDEDEKEDELSEQEESFPVSGDVKEGVEDDSIFDSELGSDVDACDDGLEMEVEHSNEGKTKTKRARCELFDTIVTYKSVKHVLELWVKEGKDLSQAEVSLAVHNLRKRRSYAMSLQLWEWLRANTSILAYCPFQYFTQYSELQSSYVSSFSARP